MKNSLIIATTCGIALASFSQAKEFYPAPKISRVILHLDRLPIDQDQMKSISRTLVSLARTKHDSSNKQLRVRAQLLMLAMRLDPKNHEAINLNKQLIQGGLITPPNKDNRSNSLRRLGHVISSLSTADQHSEAHTLALYLKDVLVGLDPSSVLLKDHQVDNQRWLHVLGRIKPKVTKVKPPKKDELNTEEADKPEKVEGKKLAADDKKMREWIQKKQQISYPLYLMHKEGDQQKDELKLVDIKLEISLNEEEGSPPITLTYSPKIKKQDDASFGKKVAKALHKQWGDFPHAHLSVKFGGSYSSKNGSNAFLPLMIEASAALNGLKIKKGVIAVGAVGGAGEIYKNHNFWTLLESIRLSNQYQRTLICPLDSQQALLQFVVLEDAEFFIRNEVIGVDNIKDALKFSVKLKDPKLLEAHEEFVKIRDLVGTKSVGSFSVNQKIKVMLENIVTLNPNHISAKMLLVRGDSRRHKYLTRTYLLEELKPMIKSLEYIYSKPVAELSSEKLREISALLKEKITQIEKYTDSSDKEIMEAFQKIVSELNNMSRSRKKKDSDYHQRSAENAHERFCSQFDIIKAALNTIK